VLAMAEKGVVRATLRSGLIERSIGFLAGIKDGEYRIRESRIQKIDPLIEGSKGRGNCSACPLGGTPKLKPTNVARYLLVTRCPTGACGAICPTSPPEESTSGRGCCLEDGRRRSVDRGGRRLSQSADFPAGFSRVFTDAIGRHGRRRSFNVFASPSYFHTPTTRERPGIFH